MKIFGISSFACCLALLVAQMPECRAQSVPKLVNYQGKLTNAGSNPLPNGTYGLAFRIWSHRSNTEVVDRLIWGKEYNVTVASGVFNVILGAPGGAPISGAVTDDIGSAFNEPSRYLGITVVRDATGAAVSDAVEIAPRQQLLSAPYALQAEVAATVLTIPRGIVVMWSGTIESIPAGWTLCDGSNGAPDLRNRFVVGANADSAGEATTTYTGSPTRVGGSVHHTHTGKTGYTTDWLHVPITGQSHLRYPNAWETNPQIDHVHAFTTDIENTVPVAYYSLAYIMKL